MREANGFGVQRMPWTDGETVLNKLFVFAEHRALDNFVAAIQLVIEQGMTDMLHMHPDLVRATGFQFALNDGNI
jgi:hypothetical protein